MNPAHALREARRRAGLTQEQAAQRFNVSLGTFRNWETGRTKPLDLFKIQIEAAFGIPRGEWV